MLLNYKNLQLKQFINDIAINLQFSRNFASMEYIRRRCNLMVDFSKFTFNKKILSKTNLMATTNFVSKLCS